MPLTFLPNLPVKSEVISHAPWKLTRRRLEISAFLFVAGYEPSEATQMQPAKVADSRHQILTAFGHQ